MTPSPSASAQGTQSVYLDSLDKVYEKKLKAKDIKGKTSTIFEGLKAPSLLGDIVNGLKLATDWNQWVEKRTGTPTGFAGSAEKMTAYGAVTKDILDAAQFPQKALGIWTALTDFSKNDFISDLMSFPEEISKLAAAVLGTGKAMLAGLQLGKAFDLVPESLVNRCKILNPLGTVSYAANELLFTNIPDIYGNFFTPEDGEVLEEKTMRRNEVGSALLKSVKHTALVGVGVLGLTGGGAYIPAVVTGSLVISLTSQFFDALKRKPDANACFTVLDNQQQALQHGH